ncbi:hypothetical protein [Pedococcus bigeumensis]|uniref:hypothetical protein n=1 Tax=Pedococcus bigeumensis TaxID=433644 RepID=UPI0030C804A6
MSRYAAWLPPSGQPGQAAEPSADFEEREADDELLEPPDSREELDEPDELDELDPLDEEPPEESLDEPLEDPPDEPESLELLGAGTDAEELLRESVR